MLGIWLLFGVTNDVLSHQLIMRAMVASIVILACFRPEEAAA